jgi:hypothetical protein
MSDFNTSTLLTRHQMAQFVDEHTSFLFLIYFLFTYLGSDIRQTGIAPLLLRQLEMIIHNNDTVRGKKSEVKGKCLQILSAQRIHRSSNTLSAFTINISYFQLIYLDFKSRLLPWKFDSIS